jgi:hypothetical protein
VLAENDDEVKSMLSLSVSRIVQVCCGRRFFITRRGFMGMGAEAMLEDDKIFLVKGASVPLILSPKRVFIGDGKHSLFEVQKTDRYLLVGQAYVHGIMYGEGYNVNNLEEFIIS